MRLLSLKDRLALSRRTPREEVVCPICGGEAERQRNGKWECVASEKQDTSFWNGVVLTILTCGARGVTVPNDEGEPELVATSWRHVEDED